MPLPNRTTRFPPPSVRSAVFVPVQLLANQSPPLLFHTVTARVSEEPGSPLSVILTWSVALPSSGIGRQWVGDVQRLALPLKVPQ